MGLLRTLDAAGIGSWSELQFASRKPAISWAREGTAQRLQQMET
jgi:hypothetical protein